MDTSRSGLIGPNAVLQLVPVLESVLGEQRARALCLRAGLSALPSDQHLMDEHPAHALHLAVRELHPTEAQAWLNEAGKRTADYIMAHRIPALAKRLLKILPASIATPLLLKAISKHAWTFAGSGEFKVVSARPPVVELRNNPLIAGENSDGPLCHWHTAVFTRLFTSMIRQGVYWQETECQGSGSTKCRFEMFDDKKNATRRTELSGR